MPSFVYRPQHPEADRFGFIPKEMDHREPPPRSDLPAPMLIADGIELQSQVDGKIYTSKSALRRSYRQAGYVEVGNEDVTQHVRKPPKDRKAIRETIGKAMARVGLPTS